MLFRSKTTIINVIYKTFPKMVAAALAVEAFGYNHIALDVKNMRLDETRQVAMDIYE